MNGPGVVSTNSTTFPTTTFPMPPPPPAPADFDAGLVLANAGETLRLATARRDFIDSRRAQLEDEYKNALERHANERAALDRLIDGLRRATGADNDSPVNPTMTPPPGVPRQLIHSD